MSMARPPRAHHASFARRQGADGVRSALTSTARANHRRGRLDFLGESHHPRELPRAVGLPLEDSQYFSAHRGRTGGVAIGEVSPLECPVARDLQILYFGLVAKRARAGVVCLPPFVVGVDDPAADLHRLSGLDANRTAVPELLQSIGAVGQ